MATPANSPCAPAMGVSEIAFMPVTALQHILQFEHACRNPGRVPRPQRMALGKSGSIASRLQTSRVVLHRARTERIEMRVDRKILLRQAREMPHDLQLGNSGSTRRESAEIEPAALAPAGRRRMTGDAARRIIQKLRFVHLFRPPRCFSAVPC